MSFTILLDSFVAILLVITIVYAVILNQKLKKFRAGESEMQTAIGRFEAATAQAEANLARLREVAEQPNNLPSRRESAEAGRALAPLVVEARKLAADLNLLIGRGETLMAEKTEAPGAGTRGFTITRPKPAASPGSGKPGRVDMANPAATWSVLDDELELIDVLKGAR